MHDVGDAVLVKVLQKVIMGMLGDLTVP